MNKLCLLFFFLIFSLSVFAQRADTVYLYNGDRITGEIKFMNGNKLTFKTDRAGTIAIEWPSVQRICSPNYYDISTMSGQRLFGTLQYDNNPDTVIIVLGEDRIKKNLADIISIDRIKVRFFDQLSGSIFLNVNYAKANENLQFNAGFDITHRSRRFVNAVSANILITSTATTERTERSDASYNFQRVYGVDWFMASALSYQRNTQLNIGSRYQLFAGGGKYFLRKPSNEFYILSGLSANEERSFIEPITQTQNVEFVAALSYHQFKFRNPQFDILANASSYTSFTVPGRFRLDLEVKILWEVFSDFKWNITFYDNFDNKPPGGENPSNDWNISTGLTYTL
jgi:hypothetical protein